MPTKYLPPMLVLIAPLDWGLGHATRCIPLIRALERAGHTVVPCAGGAGARLLRAEFPHLVVEDLPGYAMTYTRSRALLPLWLLAQLPAYLFGAWREGRAARNLARKYGAGLLIADGRMGFRAPGIPAVFVTHQLDIIPPGPQWLRALLTPVLRRLNGRALRAFTEVWVPDFPDATNLSGVLGHPAAAFVRALEAGGTKVNYIRPLCRFRPDDAPWGGPASSAVRESEAETRSLLAAVGTLDTVDTYDTLALISGPEPQRSLLEAKLHAALAHRPGTHVLVRGVPGKSNAATIQPDLMPGLNVFDHLPGNHLNRLLAAATNVVCRSGYTTLMELAGIGKSNVLLIPTPGQPEQEFLAIHAQAWGMAAWQDQNFLKEGGDLDAGFRAARALPGFAALTQGSIDDGGPFLLYDWLRAHPLLT